MDQNRRWLCLDCGKNTFEGNKNYGIYDSLTPQMRQAIDCTIIDFVASRPRKVTAIVLYVYEQAPAPIPARTSGSIWIELQD